MAYATIGVKLSISAGPTIDIKDFPDLGGALGSAQATTLSNKRHVYVAAIKSGTVLEFTFNYSKSIMTSLISSEDDINTYTLELPDGSDISWSGSHSVSTSSAGVGDVVDGKISIVPSTELTFNLEE